MSQHNQKSAAAEVMVREINTIDEYNACITLQREVFGLPDLEISPRRHLIVSREAGGWTLGAFIRGELVGFVHHLAAVHGDEIFGYSHMMAVTTRYQNHGIGARLKWAQRMRALSEGRDFIKWTFEPMRARNAHFNLNRLGVCLPAGNCARHGLKHLPRNLNICYRRPMRLLKYRLTIHHCLSRIRRPVSAKCYECAKSF